MDGLTRNSLYLVIEKGAHLLGGLVLMVGVARLLGERELARYVFIISATSLYIPILDLGLNTRAIKLVGADPKNGYSAVVDSLAFKTALAGPILLAMAIGALAAGKASGTILAVLFVGGSTIAMSMGDAVNALFKGLGKSERSALLVGSLNGTLLVLGLGSMALGFGVTMVAACYLLCRAGYLAAGVIMARSTGVKLRKGFHPRIQGATLLEGLQHLPAVYFVGTILHLTYILTNLTLGDADSSQFAIAYRLAAALFVLFSSSLEAMLPAMSRRFRTGIALRLTLLRGFAALLGITVLGVGIVQFLAYPVTIWVFGIQYSPAVEAIRVVSWTMPPFVLCGLAHTALLAMDEEVRGSLWLLTMVLVCVFGSVVAVILSGVYAAAIVPTVVGWLFVVALWLNLWRFVR